MKINKAHKIRLDPNNKQKGYFVRACGVTRFTYNWALAEWKLQYDNRDKPSGFLLKKKFNSIKKQEFPFVMDVTKCASEQAFTNLGKAFQGFFRDIKTGRKPGYPKFKKKGKSKDSFYIANDKLKFDGKKVRIPKLGWVRMRESPRLAGKILSAIVSKTAGMWFISVNVEQEVPDPIAKGPVIGVDVGVRNLATTSDGRVFKNPKALKQAGFRLRLLHKSVSRKKKGSSNRKKAVIKLARQYYKVSNIRKDSIHKATTAITKSCSCVGIESLNVEKMLQNRRLAKDLSDAAMSEFLRQIEYKSLWKGVQVVKADRFYPSSKTCSRCGYIKKDLGGNKTYICDQCGLMIDRDLNASINSKNLAVGSTVSACRLGSSGSAALQQSETTDWAGISHRSY